MMKPRITLTLFTAFSVLVGYGQISFTQQTDMLNDPTHFSGNALTIQDVNGDGLDDLIILDQAKNLMIEYQHLDGSWTTYTGGQMDDQNAWGMVVADTDNNGFSDIVSGVNGENPDYAQATFTGLGWSISDLEGYPLFYQGSSFGDVDNDGDVDLYVCADTDESAIWGNDGDGNLSFSGTDLIDLTVEGWDGSGNYGSTFTDFDLDGDLDLYISHCRQGVTDETDPRRINQLFENDGNNNYTDNASAYGLDIGSQTWTSDFADIDNDGDFDIIMTNHDVNNMLWENLDDSDQYENIFDSAIGTQEVGFPLQSMFKDFDNDGFVDLLITGNSHALYKNNGDQTFTLVENAFPGPDMLSMAIGDLDHDGFLDVYASYGNIYNSPSNTRDEIWINEGNSNHFMTLVLEGTITNRDAIGAQVRIYGDWGMQVREIRSGESYGIVNSLHAHFGIGQSTSIDSVVVDWPTSGIHQVIENPAIDQFLTIVEDDCVSSENVISAGGSFVLCPGESLELAASIDPDAEYLWSDGSTEQTLTVNQGGTYMVQITNSLTGCTSVSASVQVELAPDETPSISADGDIEFCQGSSVILTSSEADSYEWSVTGESTQSIEVTESGTYAVTIDGSCEDFTSESILVTVLDTPQDTPSADDVTIPSAQSVTLSATGSGDELRWFDMAEGGNLLATGEEYITPVVSATTSFWVESVNVFEGGSGSGGKEDISSGQYHPNADFYLIFDAFEDFLIEEVKVFADDAGQRTIQLRDSDGDIVETATMMVPAGESYVELGFLVPEGTDYSLRGTGDPGLWRDNDGPAVNFPYPLATYGSITGTNVNPNNADNYYYFFYDWQVSIESVECAGDREEVVVELVTSLNDFESLEGIQIYPNPSDEMLNIQFDRSIDGAVIMELFDITGKQVVNETINNANTGHISILDVSGLESGVYVFRLLNEEQGYTRSIQVK